MKLMAINQLKQVAQTHNISYDTPPSSFANGIHTKMEKTYKLAKTELFKKIADLRDHTRLFSHLSAVNVINSDAVANVIGKNQYIIVEGLAEGGSKLGVKLMTLVPDDEIRCELYTDLFETAKPDGPARIMDRKKGSITWKFREGPPGESILTAESDFEIGQSSAYVRETVDHVWMDFFENVMVDTGELNTNMKMAKPFDTI